MSTCSIMRQPFPHGINPNFKINKTQARKHNLYNPSVGMPVSKWKSTSDTNPKSDEKTYDKFKSACKTISKHFIQQPALVRFTRLLAEYMDLETTRNKYNEDFEEAVLDRRLELEEERSRKKIKIIQTQILNEELSAEIGCSSLVAEKDGNDSVDDDLSNTTGEAEDIQKKNLQRRRETSC